MRVLALETSCDETAAAVVERTREGAGKILSNVVLSQIEEHAAFGGVVPEIAARAHANAIDGVVKAALSDAECDLGKIDAIAATCGPGLNGGLLVGATMGKGLAKGAGLPFYPINHLEGHALTPRLTDGLTFPYLLFLVSGGHTQILIVSGVGSYERLATTIDDAIGEAFDKTAKLLGLGYPGGPIVERRAAKGDPKRFTFPRPMLDHETLNLSLSGLKTAVRQQAEKCAPLQDADIDDLCAGFQAAIVDVLANRAERAIDLCTKRGITDATLVVAGGVAANKTIAASLDEVTTRHDWSVYAPPLALCGDNAAMIGWAALERMTLGERGDVDFVTRPRWPLDTAHGEVVGHGKRGAKV